MKYGMKLSNYDIAMIGNLSALTEDKMKGILVDKGDIEMPDIMKHRNSIKWVPLVDFCWEEFDDSFEVPNGKSMKRADRRKSTFHKREQRKKMYINKGYTIERLDERDIGMLGEGVGAVPRCLHMDSMYFHGDKAKKKMKKPITALEAMALIEEQKRLDAEDVAKEYMEAEKAFAKEYISDMECEVKRLTEMMENTKDSIIELEKHINELRNQFEEAYGLKRHLSDKIKEMEVFVDSEE